MRTGELARRAEVNIQTLRYYEREGLLPPPGRSPSGYRAYQPHDLERVRMIRQCQSLGFTLAEIRELLDLHQTLAAPGLDPQSRSSVEAALIGTARSRLALMEEKIRVLTRMKRDLERLVDAVSGPGDPVCALDDVRPG